MDEIRLTGVTGGKLDRAEGGLDLGKLGANRQVVLGCTRHGAW